MKTDVKNIPAPVRMTPCHPRLQLQTLWIGVILTGKMTFWGYKCLTKVDHTMKIGVLNIPAPIILIPLKSLTFKGRRTCPLSNGQIKMKASLRTTEFCDLDSGF